MSIDNARGVLIILVVAGHLVEPLLDTSAVARGLYVTVYAFHIPALVFVSGYLTKVNTLQKTFRKLVPQLLVPYVLLQGLYSAWDYVVYGRPELTFAPLKPYWLLWYLVSLVFWRIAIIGFSRIRLPISTAVVLALVAGISPDVGHWMSLSRTLVFLPFFVLGYVCRTRRLSWAKIDRRVLVAVLATGAGVGLLVAGEIDVRWLYGSHSYAKLNTGIVEGLAFRALLLLWSTSLTIAFLSTVRSAPPFVTRIGERSLYPYVLHGFVIMALSNVLSEDAGIEWVMLWLVLAAPLAAWLSSNTVVLLSKPVVQPSWLWRPLRHAGDSSSSLPARDSVQYRSHTQSA